MFIRGRQLIVEYDRKIAESRDLRLAEEANRKLCAMAKEETVKALNDVLMAASEKMRNAYHLDDY